MLKTDKLLHLTLCAVIAILTGLISHYLLNHPTLESAGVGVFAALFVGICKELYDALIEEHSWEKGDLVADFAGAVIGGIIGYLIMIL